MLCQDTSISRSGIRRRAGPIRFAGFDIAVWMSRRDFVHRAGTQTAQIVLLNRQLLYLHNDSLQPTLQTDLKSLKPTPLPSRFPRSKPPRLTSTTSASNTTISPPASIKPRTSRTPKTTLAITPRDSSTLSLSPIQLNPSALLIILLHFFLPLSPNLQKRHKHQTQTRHDNRTQKHPRERERGICSTLGCLCYGAVYGGCHGEAERDAEAEGGLQDAGAKGGLCGREVGGCVELRV